MMLTRCPACSTAFRVTPEQLKARSGKVRCGHCNSVFNALETLEDSPSAAETVEITAPPAESLSSPITADMEIQETALESAPDAEPPVAEAEVKAAESQPVSPQIAGIGEPPPPIPGWQAYAWSAAGLIALGLLLTQAVYIFRAELAVSQPDLRPQLEALCSALGCEIPLPRKADLVSIEASDLHPDPQRQPLLVLAATLKNRAPFVQDYPYLELTLTDTRDQPVVRKVFAPVDYLMQSIDAKSGFPANHDLAVNLWLDVGEAGASGYRIYVFYP
jgi:predicted Zn finger-like uncharacterized protein